MSLASRLYQLQEIELQLRDQRRQLRETTDRLEHNDELSFAESTRADTESSLKHSEKQQKELEWEVADLTARIRALNDRLYGGGVRNPKELLNLEQEIQASKKHLAAREERLLECMEKTELLQAEFVAVSDRAISIRSNWDLEKASLRVAKEALEADTAQLADQRVAIREELGLEITQRYDLLTKAKGRAMVKVEQGRCKGCNLTVPAGQWQRARAGELVECSSCGCIIFVE